MGKTIKTYFTGDQEAFLQCFRHHADILPSWYLTGGTALSAYYFNHRLSEDIDLFTRNPFRQEGIIAMMAQISTKLHARSSYRVVDTSLRYELVLPKKHMLKIDFIHYEFDQLKKPNILDGLPIDSIEDIAVNKLLTISQRTASKDYVDLYFILKKYTFWDLRLGVERKFRMEIDSFYLASLLKKADELEIMPVMKKKLTLEELQSFFRSQAKLLAAPLLRP